MRDNDRTRVILGLLILLIGCYWMGNNLGLINIDLAGLFSTYWPVLLILPGLILLIGYIRPGQNKRRSIIICGAGIFLLLLGTAFLIDNLHLLPISSVRLFWEMLGPAILIIIGISLILNKTEEDNSNV